MSTNTDESLDRSSTAEDEEIFANTNQQIDDAVVGCVLNSVRDAAPPSVHMRLGHGLANADCAPKNISCFGSTEEYLTLDDQKKKKLLSESDLFAVLECAVENCHNKAQV